jgi:hypothetical protein
LHRHHAHAQHERFVSVRLAFAALGATSHLAVALLVRFSTSSGTTTPSSSFTSSSSSSSSSAALSASAGAVNVFGAAPKNRGIGAGGGSGSGGGLGWALGLSSSSSPPLAPDEADAVCFVGNGATVVALALATAYRVLSSSSSSHVTTHGISGGVVGGGATLTLGSFLSWAPLTLLLLLLRDDGGVLGGLGNRNKYWPSLATLLGRLSYSTLHALFLRGAPFLVTPAVSAAAKAAAARHHHQQAMGGGGGAAFAALGLDAVAAAKVMSTMCGGRPIGVVTFPSTVGRWVLLLDFGPLCFHFCCRFMHCPSLF